MALVGTPLGEMNFWRHVLLRTSGVAGQLKEFNLDEYLGEGTETDSSVPWAIRDDAVSDPAVGSLSVDCRLFRFEFWL